MTKKESLMKNKPLAYLLSLFLVISLLAGCGTTPAESAAPASAAAEPESAAEPAAEPSETPTPEPEITPEPVEKTGDIMILYTSDVHCGINQGFGCVGLQAVRDSLENKGYTTLLVDDGDAVQGEPIGSMTSGSAIIDLMNALKYDVAIPGNHEFDYGMERFMELTEMAEFPYISCNFNYRGEPVFDPYLIKEVCGVKIAFVGITTPQTVATSTPSFFKNDNNEFVYDFSQDETGEKLYSAVQSAVDAARAEGADYVYVLGHCGLGDNCHPWTYADILSNTTGIDVMLDGHSHDTEQVVMKNKNGEDVIRSACGSKLQNIGWSEITKDGEISAGLYTWTNDVPAPELLGLTNSMTDAILASTNEFNELLNEVVGTTLVDLTIFDPTATDSNGNKIRMVRRAETNLGDFCADAYRAETGADIGISNSGSVRMDVPAGDITRNNLLSVAPFGNILCVIEATGQQILDALEWGSRVVPAETGGFLQVSGLTYEVHSYIDSPCMTDENSMCSGIGDGERRVKNVTVGGEPIDPEKTYTVGGTAYILIDNGDGVTAYNGCTVLRENIEPDYQALINYITNTLGGTVGEEYADPYGQGRITIVEEAQP